MEGIINGKGLTHKKRVIKAKNPAIFRFNQPSRYSPLKTQPVSKD